MPNLLIFILITIFNPGATYEEVKKQRRLNGEDNLVEFPATNLDIAALNVLLETAKESQRLQKERTITITDKMKTVLLLLIALLPFLVQFVSEDMLSKWLSLVAGVLVIFSVFILLFFLSPKTYMEVNVLGMKGTDCSETLTTLIKDYHKASQFNQRVNDFLVNVYWANAKSFGVALLVLVFLAGYHYWTDETTAQKQQSWGVNVLKAIQDDELYKSIIQKDCQPITTESSEEKPLPAEISVPANTVIPQESNRAPSAHSAIIKANSNSTTAPPTIPNP